MASQSHVVSDTSSSSIFSTLLQRNRDISLLLPFIIGFSAARNSDDPPPETASSDDPRRQRVILINPFTQGVVLIDGDPLFREMGAITKSGLPPATEESIAGLEIVKIGGEDEEKGECVICLEEWEIGGVVKKMPCNHKFHGNCIEKWLGIHGCCPVCRYEMPVEDKQEGKKEDDNGGERTRVISTRDVWVSFSFTGGNNQNDQHPSRDSTDSSYSSSTPSSEREEQS